MFSRDMIFTRERIAVWRRFGGESTSPRSPSIRYRTRKVFSYGSRWMSLAPRSIALAMMKFTSRMMGASDATPMSRSTFSSSVRISSPSSPTCSTSRSIEEPDSPYIFSIVSRTSSSVPARTTTRRPVALATASRASASSGSAMATTSVPSSRETGTRRRARRKVRGRISAGTGLTSDPSPRNGENPQRLS